MSSLQEIEKFASEFEPIKEFTPQEQLNLILKNTILKCKEEGIELDYHNPDELLHILEIATVMAHELINSGVIVYV